jgi:hypothetical protein
MPHKHTTDPKRISRNRTAARKTSRSKLPRGAAAAQRASAGMGTEDLEPADWLFGDLLLRKRSS